MHNFGGQTSPRNGANSGDDITGGLSYKYPVAPAVQQQKLVLVLIHVTSISI
jgi:hypothetical protein